jgi:hypothetical protein
LQQQKRQKRTCKEKLEEDVFTEQDLRLIAEDWDKPSLQEEDYQEICNDISQSCSVDQEITDEDYQQLCDILLNDEEGKNGGTKRRVKLRRRTKTKRRVKRRLRPRTRRRRRTKKI